jgi:serine/threonine-protein kinase
LTGAPPFTGATIVEVCGHHLHTPPDPPSERLGRPVAPKLEALLLACLAKAPEKRPRDALELVTLLSESEGERPWNPALAKDWWARWRANAKKPRGLAFDATVARDVA